MHRVSLRKKAYINFFAPGGFFASLDKQTGENSAVILKMVGDILSSALCCVRRYALKWARRKNYQAIIACLLTGVVDRRSTNAAIES
ncbi:hypothetical protein BC008_06795 [Mastigocoleus testarum BC008]|uniref:Uncharacterized protein n=1 Tax=Mastigocoleus testarum BC008 TaxID=371196 RepID=A0A0V8A0L5_9CYAN|nr:hypothetical protein BC008_06795 [Mastigocoleus testarum BC008]